MIPFFLPCWQSTVIRDVILGFLLAASLVHAVDERAPARPAKSSEATIQDSSPPVPDRAQRSSRGNVVEIESGLFVRQ
jgi:hypothetical protein